MSKILRRSCEVLKEGGALYLYHVPRWAVRFAEVLRQEGMELRHWIAIAMKNGFVRGRRLYPAHYGLLYFTKHEPRVFRRPKIPVSKCRHCGKEIKDYGGYKKYVRNGVNLSDVWDDISPVRHTIRKTRTSNELPQEILRRVLRISGKKTGLLVDPFAGSGTALVAAKAIGMRFIGCDREARYCALMKRRLAA